MKNIRVLFHICFLGLVHFKRFGYNFLFKLIIHLVWISGVMDQYILRFCFTVCILIKIYDTSKRKQNFKDYIGGNKSAIPTGLDLRDKLLLL